MPLARQTQEAAGRKRREQSHSERQIPVTRNSARLVSQKAGSAPRELDLPEPCARRSISG